MEKLLSDLDSLGAPSAAASESRASSEQARTSTDSGKEKAADSGAGAGAGGEATGSGQPPDAQSLLDDLDSLVQQRRPLSRGTNSKPGTPSKAGSSLSRTTSSTGISHTAKDDGTEARRSGLGASSTSAAPIDASAGLDPEAGAAGSAAATSSATRTSSSGGGGSGGGWGSSWGSVWNSATKLAEGARVELEKRAQSEQAKELQTKGWGFAKNVRGLLQETGLEKIGADLTSAGKKGWTDIVNAVAPPIQAHEVIQVNLSHGGCEFSPQFAL